jgi:hypothetical protein
MRKLNLILMMTLALVVSMPVSAATIAFWDFEDGVAGQAFTPTGQPNGSGGSADLVAGYLMYGWNDYYGPYWSDASDIGGTLDGSSLCMRNADNHQDGYATNTALAGWSPSTWTIECSVYLLEMDGWETIIGRDGQTSGTSESDFYLSNNGINDAFRINIYTVGGARYILDSSVIPVINKWYHLAVTSDGVTLKMYLYDGVAYDLVGSMDMSAQTVAQNALGNANNANWTFGRGWYGNNFVDHINGYMDNVRFSDVALDPGSFVIPAKIVSESPANGDTLVPVARTSPRNDLIFSVYDPDITEVDVLFGTENDPNLTANAAYKIVDGMAVTPGQYTVNLESLPANLAYDTVYYWKVVGYEPNAITMENDIVFPGTVYSFTTIPANASVTLNDAFVAVPPGTDAVLSVSTIAVDTYQWWKVGTPDVALTNGADYSGVDTDTLTVLDVQPTDEGYFYCVGTNALGSDTGEIGRVMIQRQTSYYDFESVTSLPDGNDVFVDSIDGYHAVLMQEAASAGLPTFSDANELISFNALQSFGNHLVLDNGDHATDPNGQFLQIYPGVVDYEDLTISVWVHPKDTGVFARIFDFGNGTTDYLYLTPDVGGYDMRFSIRIDNAAEQQLVGNFDSSNWMAPGSWYHVAVTLQGNVGRLYRNGELVATNTGMTVNPIDIGAVLNYIGKSQYPNDPEFSGLIDELKIYNYALTSEQIATEYVNIAGGWVCNNEGTVDLTYDFDGDCQVGLTDFAEIAADWLNSNRIYPD